MCVGCSRSISFTWCRSPPLWCGLAIAKWPSRWALLWVRVLTLMERGKRGGHILLFFPSPLRRHPHCSATDPGGRVIPLCALIRFKVQFKGRARPMEEYRLAPPPRIQTVTLAPSVACRSAQHHTGTFLALACVPRLRLDLGRPHPYSFQAIKLKLETTHTHTRQRGRHWEKPRREEREV